MNESNDITRSPFEGCPSSPSSSSDDSSTEDGCVLVSRTVFPLSTSISQALKKGTNGRPLFCPQWNPIFIGDDWDGTHEIERWPDSFPISATPAFSLGDSDEVFSTGDYLEVGFFHKDRNPLKGIFIGTESSMAEPGFRQPVNFTFAQRIFSWTVPDFDPVNHYMNEWRTPYRCNPMSVSDEYHIIGFCCEPACIVSSWGVVCLAKSVEYFNSFIHIDHPASYVTPTLQLCELPNMLMKVDPIFPSWLQVPLKCTDKRKNIPIQNLTLNLLLKENMDRSKFFTSLDTEKVISYMSVTLMPPGAGTAIPRYISRFFIWLQLVALNDNHAVTMYQETARKLSLPEKPRLKKFATRRIELNPNYKVSVLFLFLLSTGAHVDAAIPVKETAPSSVPLDSGWTWYMLVAGIIFNWIAWFFTSPPVNRFMNKLMKKMEEKMSNDIENCNIDRVINEAKVTASRMYKGEVLAMNGRGPPIAFRRRPRQDPRARGDNTGRDPSVDDDDVSQLSNCNTVEKDSLYHPEKNLPAIIVEPEEEEEKPVSTLSASWRCYVLFLKLCWWYLSVNSMFYYAIGPKVCVTVFGCLLFGPYGLTLFFILHFIFVLPRNLITQWYIWKGTWNANNAETETVIPMAEVEPIEDTGATDLYVGDLIPNFLESYFGPEEIEEPVTTSFGSIEGFQKYLTDSGHHRAVIHFCCSLMFLPRYSDGKLRCIAALANAFTRFTTDLLQYHKGKGDGLVAMIKKKFEKVYVAQSGTDASAVEWVEKVSEACYELSSFKSSKLSGSVSSLFSLVVAAPLLFSRAYNAETFSEFWKATSRLMEKGGSSINSILELMLSLHGNVTLAQALGNPATMLQIIFKPDSFQKDFVDCKKILREAELGNDIGMTDDEVIAKLRTVTSAAAKRASRVSAGPHEASQYDAMNEMLSKWVRLDTRSRQKTTPFVVSIHGSPGIGKSVLTQRIIDDLHQVAGMSDYQNVSYVDLTAKFDNSTTNRTTMIVADDQGQLKPEVRKESFMGLLLKLGQPHQVEVPKAALHEKGIYFYRHHFMMLIDNEPTRGIKSESTAPMAGYRRFGYVVEAILKEEFADSHTGLIADSRKGDIGHSMQHLLFQCHRFVKPSKDGPERLEKVGEPMEAPQFRLYLVSLYEKHVKEEELRMQSAEDYRSLPKCPACKILTVDECQCCVEKTDDEWAAIYKAEVGFSDVIEAISPSPNFVAATTEYVSGYLRLYLCGNTYKAALISAFIKHPISEWITLFLLLAKFYFMRIGFYLKASTFDILVVISIFILYSFLCVIKFKLKRLVLRSNQEIARMVVGASQTFWMCSGVLGVMSAIATGRMLIRSGVVESIFRKCYVAEAGVDLKEDEAPLKVPIFEEKKEEAVVIRQPIWTVPRRVPPRCTKAAKTTAPEDLKRMVKANLKICTLHFEDARRRFHGLFITHSIMMCAAHSLLSASGEIIRGEMEFEDRDETHLLPLMNIYIVKDRDIAFLLFPNCPYNTMKCLQKYLPISEGEGRIELTRVRKRCNTAELVNDETSIVHDGNVSYTRPDGKSMSTPHYLFPAVTGSSDGDCGAPYLSIASPRLISGIHVAGNGTNCVVAKVTNSGFAEAVEYFRSNSGYILETDQFEGLPELCGKPTGIIDCEQKDNPVHFQTNDGRIIQIFGEFGVNFRNRTSLKLNEHIDAATEIMELRVLTRPPQMLWKHSFQKVLQSGTAPFHPLMAHELVAAADHIVDQSTDILALEAKKNPGLAIGRLTIETALNGIPGSGLCRVALNKAAGPPLLGKKKKWVMEGHDGHIYPSKELLSGIQELIAMVTSGMHANQIVNSFMKDEPVKEVDGIPKPCRVVNCDPFPMYTAFRMYIGPAVQAMTNNGGFFETAIGADRTSIGWLSLHSKFVQPNFVNNCFDGDFKSFDLTQCPALKRQAARVFIGVLAKLGFNKPQLEFAEKLISCLILPVVMMGGTLVEARNVLTSGTLVTAHLNGLITSILLRVEVRRFMEFIGADTRKFGSFYDKNFALITLGDDFRLAASDEVRAMGWNLDRFKLVCTEFCLTLTNAQKGDDLEFKHFTETEFLKSYTHYHEGLQRVVGAVGPASYFRGLGYYLPSDEISRDQQHCEVLTSILAEAFYGGRESFDWIHSRVVKYVTETGLPNFPELHRTFQEWIENDADTPQENPFPGREEVGASLIQEYSTRETIPIVRRPEAPYKAEAEEMGAQEQMSEVLMQTDQADTPPSITETTGALASRIPVDPTSGVELSLRRRYLIDSIEWGATTTTFTLDPFSLMAQQLLLQDRMKHIAFFRADVKMEIELSAPSSYAGAIMASVDYCPLSGGPEEAGSSAEGVDCLHSQRPNVILRAGNADGNFSLTVPFLHPFNMVFFKSMASLATPLPNVNFRVLSPLTTVFIAEPGSILINVYGTFENISYTGSTAASAALEYHAEVEELNEPSKLLNTLGTAMVSTGIPPVATAGTILKGAGMMAKAAGFSKPMTVSAMRTQPTTTAFMANFEGNIAGEKLALSPLQSTSLAASGFSGDELSFENLIRKWSLFKIMRLRTQIGFGLDFEFPITPSIFVGPSGNHNTTPASCAIPCMFYREWYGTMEYRFLVIVPTGVAGRLIFYYDPLPKGGLRDGEDNATQDTLNHVIIDVEKTDELEIHVKYTSGIPTLKTLGRVNPDFFKDANITKARSHGAVRGNFSRFSAPAGEAESMSHNGFMRVVELSPLTSASGKSVDVNILCYARAGPDMEFYGYVGMQSSGMIPVLHQYFPPGDPIPGGGSSPIVEAPDCKTYVCQSGPIFGAPPKETPAPSPSPEIQTIQVDATPMLSRFDPDAGNMSGDGGLAFDDVETSQSVFFGTDRNEPPWGICSPTFGRGPGNAIHSARINVQAITGSYTSDADSDQDGILTFDGEKNGKAGRHCFVINVQGLATKVVASGATSYVPEGMAYASQPPVPSTQPGWDTRYDLSDPPKEIPGYSSSSGFVVEAATEEELFRVRSFGKYTRSIVVVYFGPIEIFSDGILIESKNSLSNPQYENWNAFQVDVDDTAIVVVKTGPGGLVHRFSQLRMSQPGYSWPLPGQDQVFSHRLGEPVGSRIRRLLENITYKGEVENPDTLIFEFGGGTDSDTKIIHSGELTTSFRQVLKMETFAYEHIFAGNPQTLTTGIYKHKIYDLGIPTVVNPMMYLATCFAAIRGGVKTRMCIIGDAQIEVSTNIESPRGYLGGPTTLADSRINPSLVVTTPYIGQENFAISAGIAGGFSNDNVRYVRVHGWNGPIKIREFISSAEDFNMFAFRGAGFVKYALPGSI